MEVAEVKKSTHKVEVVRIKPEVHPNADKMWIAKVYGYVCCIAKEDWGPRLVDGECLAAYLPPDSLAPVIKPEFSFLADQAKADGFARIKAKKLRGVVSFGLLVPAPAGVKEGDDIADMLGVGHYEPPLPGQKKGGFFMGGEVTSGPTITTYKYDVDAFRRYNHLFVAREKIMVTEKLDGCNSRYVFNEDTMYCGSRTEWKKEFPNYDHLSVGYLVEKGMEFEKAVEVMDKLMSGTKKKNLWWQILEKTPTLEKFCKDNPGLVVYGECFGQINNIKYGLPDINRFAAFDVLKEGRWIDAVESRDMLVNAGVPVVSLVGIMDYDFDTVCNLAEGKTLVSDAKPKTIREGIVIKPLQERWDPRVGRICFKAVSSAYLEKNFEEAPITSEDEESIMV